MTDGEVPAPPLDHEQRGLLRSHLRERHPWVADPDHGPTTVDAGECDRCGQEARLVTTCGPDGQRLGRRCAAELGPSAWCEGHADEALAALQWLSRLPAEADDVARLWWVATGEVRLRSLVPLLRRALPEPPDELSDFR